LQACAVGLLVQKDAQVARADDRRAGERACADHPMQVTSGPDQDAYGERERLRDRALEHLLHLVWSPVGVEHGVTAHQERADAGTARAGQHLAKVAHADAPIAPDIDAAEKGRVGRQRCRASRAAAASRGPTTSSRIPAVESWERKPAM